MLAEKPLVLHQTDLFLPPADPDDHYDLATQFALASLGHTEMHAVLIDFPPERHSRSAPALNSVGQLGVLTGIWPHIVVGSPEPFAGRDAIGSPIERTGADRVLRLLENADRPVDIHVVGSCRDVANAAETDRSLFAAKCRRLYLNAGSSKIDRNAPVEYNVEMDADAFVAMFDLPCPTFWLPCFEVTDERVVTEYASHWSLAQADFLADLPPAVRRYLTYALDGGDREWIQALRDDIPLSASRASERRSMWCTAGFLHAAGLAVGPTGEIFTQRSSGAELFDFQPVTWTCNARGEVEWAPTDSASRHFILHIQDTTRYETGMTAALSALLSRIR